jgi:hypothetical protein
VEIGFYTSRTAVIRSILAQELPRHLGRYQATTDESKELPACDDGGRRRRNISVYMTKRMYANVNEVANVLEVSKSELIRMAIDRFFREDLPRELIRKLEVDGA